MHCKGTEIWVVLIIWQKIMEEHLVRLFPFHVALLPTEALNIMSEVPANFQLLHKL
jgi:hypothetical protein